MAKATTMDELLAKEDDGAKQLTQGEFGRWNRFINS